MSGPPGIGGLLEEHAKRIYNLEQTTTTPGNYPGTGGDEFTNEFDEIFIGPEGDRTRLSAEVDPPSNLVVSTGAYEEDSYVDVSWTPPSGENWSHHEVTLVEPSGDDWVPVEVQVAYGNSVRFSGLTPLKQYGVQVSSINRIGLRTSSPLPGPSHRDYHGFTASRDQTTPNQVTGVVVSSGLKSLVVRWNQSTDTDVARGRGLYQVQIATNTTFSNIVHDRVVSATLMSVTDLNRTSNYRVRVRAIDDSGNEGPWSSTASRRTEGVSGADIETGSITADHAVFDEAAIVSANIANLDADKLIANTGDFSFLKSTVALLSTVNIRSGGSLRIGNTTNGLYMDSTNGIRMWQSGTLRVHIPAGGNPVFDGNITARGGSITGSLTVGNTLTLSSGGAFRSGTSTTGRINIDPDNRMRIYAGNSSWAWELYGGSGGLNFRHGQSGNSVRMTNHTSDGSTIQAGRIVATGRFTTDPFGIDLNARTGHAEVSSIGAGTGEFWASSALEVNGGISVTPLGYNPIVFRVGHDFDQVVVSDITPRSTNMFYCGSNTRRFWQGYATSWVSTSDERAKESVQETDLGLDFVRYLKPSKYHLSEDVDHEIYHYGLTTQQVESALQRSGVSKAGFVIQGEGEDEWSGLVYNELFSPIVRAIQELADRLDELEGAGA